MYLCLAFLVKMLFWQMSVLKAVSLQLSVTANAECKRMS